MVRLRAPRPVAASVATQATPRAAPVASIPTPIRRTAVDVEPLVTRLRAEQLFATGVSVERSAVKVMPSAARHAYVRTTTPETAADAATCARQARFARQVTVFRIARVDRKTAPAHA